MMLAASGMLLSQVWASAPAASVSCQQHSASQCELAALLSSRAGSLELTPVGGKAHYVANEPLMFSISVGAKPAYLTISYVSADDVVHHLVQDGGPVEAGTVLSFGDGTPGQGTIFVDEPYGGEMLLAIASSGPLFSEKRETSESADSFADAVLAGFDRAANVEAAFLLLTTSSGD